MNTQFDVMEIRKFGATIFSAFVLLLVATFDVHAQNYETRANHALLIDAGSNSILFEKEADVQIPPASLAKLMTMEVVFHALSTGELSPSDEFLISENAWRRGGANSGGSTMFAKLNSTVSLENLIRGIIIQSANDACIAVAEGMAGSEAAFASIMNQRAIEIGLIGSNFRNSTGLPDPDQYVTLKDLAKLSRHIITTYPQWYKIYSELEFEWNGILQRNRNPLLRAGIGADGMKTGYTDESGYAIVGTTQKEGKRFIAVMSGMKTKRERAEESRKLLDWGSRAFQIIDLFDDEEVIGQARVYGGDKRGVDVVGKGPIAILVPKGNRDRLRARIVYQGPLMPPVQQGDQVATLKVWIGDILSQETPLYAAETVEKGGLVRRASDAASELLLGWIKF